MYRIDKSINFLQFGAGDGVTDDTFCDYIDKYDWSGLLVEPVPNLYRQLKQKYKNRSNISTLNACVDFHTSYIKSSYWFEYDLKNNNHCTIYPTRSEAIDDVPRLLRVNNLKSWIKFKMINSLSRISLKHILFDDIIANKKFDLIHICEPIVSTITSDTWQHVQVVCAEHGVKMISYDKPGGKDVLCSNVDSNLYTLTNKGIGELDVYKFSVPRDYGVDNFDSARNYKYRVDRNLIINKK